MRLTSVLAALALPVLAHAAPGYIPIQGTLADSAGAPIDGQVDVSFTLYSDANGTLSLWTDTLTLDVVDGRFATELGGNIALDLDTFRSYPSVHLQIQVSGDSAMPLVPLDHVPYAAAAESAASAETLQGSSLADIRAEIPTVSDITAASFDTEAELTAVLDDNYLGTGYAPAWTELTGVPAGFADDSDDGFTTEPELTALLDDNYLGTGYAPAWTELTGVPAGFADNSDDGFTTEAELTALLDDNYLGTSYAPAWTSIGGRPAGLDDGDDVGFTTETELTGLLDDNYLGVSYAPAWADITGRPAGLDDGDDVGDPTPDTIADDGVISDAEASDVLSIDNGLLTAPASGGTVTVHGRLVQRVTKLRDGSTSTVDRAFERYIVEASPAQVGRVMPLDTTVLHRLCRDDDGCSMQVQMVNWDGGQPGNVASRDWHLFISQTSNWWRVSTDGYGLDNNASVTDIAAWDCYFTDAENRINNSNGRADSGQGFGALNIAGGYSDSITTCRWVFTD